MKNLVIGITAHVDSGKTTLSEALLYASGAIRTPGRVDNKNSFLDTNPLEKERGITIFSKQAKLHVNNTQITLIDTPGHIDFTCETERALSILDYAVLVIDGTRGVQSHTVTLWKLLDFYNIPVFIFVNKMDSAQKTASEIADHLRKQLSDKCVDFTESKEDFFENCAVCDDSLLSTYLKNGVIHDKEIAKAILQRKIFPCFFGSALKHKNIDDFLSGLDKYTLEKDYPEAFGAKVYKISDDIKGQRLTFMKITGGKLSVKSVIDVNNTNQKINELRIYSGDKYTSVDEAHAGSVCAAVGLTGTAAGTGLGFEQDTEAFCAEPIFTYSVKLPDGFEISKAIRIFRKLEEENPKLNVSFDEHLQKINIQLMGDIELEIIKRILADRFSMDAEFEHGSIIYKETISASYEGVGHYEPLGHYAEVHLMIEPLKSNGRVVIAVDPAVAASPLDDNYQKLVVSHLSDRINRGVLTNSPLTDIKITLVSGKAHQKHTEGGDFIQAAYRALRQGLMQAKADGNCVLLEPWYSFTLELPTEHVGRAMTDLSRMGAQFQPPAADNGVSIIKGKVPVSQIRDYGKILISYTHGSGKLFCTFQEYARCINAEEIIASAGYDAQSDLTDSPSSVFCSHGSSFLVKWDNVHKYMHIPALNSRKEDCEQKATVQNYRKMADDDAEILRIFEMTYGKIKRRAPEQLHTPKKAPPEKKRSAPPSGPTYLLVDGYNIIHAWDDLNRAANESLDLARTILINRLCNYQAMRQVNLILVFDAYKVSGQVRESEKIHGITVVYTKEAETADQYIEKTSTELSKNYRVRVATSDAQVQMIIFGSGALRVSALEFQREVEEAEREIKDFIQNNPI